MGRKKKYAGSNSSQKSKTTMILLKVLIYLVCIFAVASEGMARIHEANQLVGITAYTVNRGYGEVVKPDAPNQEETQQTPAEPELPLAQDSATQTGTAEVVTNVETPDTPNSEEKDGADAGETSPDPNAKEDSASENDDQEEKADG